MVGTVGGSARMAGLEFRGSSRLCANAELPRISRAQEANGTGSVAQTIFHVRIGDSWRMSPTNRERLRSMRNGDYGPPAGPILSSLSVAQAIRLTAPLLKRTSAQLIGQVDHGNGPLRVGHGDLLVDEGVVEAGGGGFLVGSGKKPPGGARPVDCPEAHRTRFAGGVHVASGEPCPMCLGAIY